MTFCSFGVSHPTSHLVLLTGELLYKYTHPVPGGPNGMQRPPPPDNVVPSGQVAVATGQRRTVTELLIIFGSLHDLNCNKNTRNKTQTVNLLSFFFK